MNLFSTMYLRPGNLWKSFRIKELKTNVIGGHPVTQYVDSNRDIIGILAEADSNMADRKKHMWDQDQHSLTHTLAVKGMPELKKGDFLTLEERGFLVLLVDDIGSLGVSGLIYLEERNDIK